MSLLSKLNRLTSYKSKLFKTFNKIINKLESINAKVEVLNAKAIDEMNKLEKILEDGKVVLAENHKTLEKFRELIK